MVTTIPSAAECEADGFVPEDFEIEAELWPENWPAWCLFEELQTQWRTAGLAGTRYGLDYAVLFARLDRLAPDADHWDQLYADVRVLEAAALEHLSKPEH